MPYGQSVPERTAPNELADFDDTTNGERVLHPSKIGKIGTANGPTPPCFQSNVPSKSGGDVEA